MAQNQIGTVTVYGGIAFGKPIKEGLDKSRVHDIKRHGPKNEFPNNQSVREDGLAGLPI